MEELVEAMGLGLSGATDKRGNYVVDIPDSNIYGKVYSKLETNPDFEENDSSSITTHEMSSIQFAGEKFEVTLLGNLDDDTYRLVIKERR